MSRNPPAGRPASGRPMRGPDGTLQLHRKDTDVSFGDRELRERIEALVRVSG